MPQPSFLQLAARGAPLLLFCAGGSYLLSRFTSGTVAARDLRQKSQSAKAFAIEEEDVGQEVTFSIVDGDDLGQFR